MVCQVALADARIILSTVKNSGRSVGLFACFQQNVVFKISIKGGGSFLFIHRFSAVYLIHFDILLYFLYFSLLILHYHCSMYTTAQMAQEWCLITC